GIRDLIVTGVQTCALPILEQTGLASCSSKCWRVVSVCVGGLSLVSRFGGGGGMSWQSSRVRTSFPRCTGDEVVAVAWPTRMVPRSEERRVGKEGRWGG